LSFGAVVAAFGSPFLASLPPAGSSFFAEEVEAAVDGAAAGALWAAGLLLPPYLPFFLAFAARAAFLFSALIFFLRL